LILRAATWNCQHGRPDPGRVGEAVAALAALDLDVLAIQEIDRGTQRVDGRDLAAAAEEAFGGTLLWAEALALKPAGTYGHALLVRGEVARSEVIRLPGRRRHEPRVAVVAEVEAAGRSWTIASTHLTTDRGLSPEQLLVLVDVLRRRPAPRVVMGDLNLEVDEVLPFLTAESYRLALGPLTHSVKRPRRQIDHVAVNGRGCAVTPLGAMALPVGDHLALLATVHVPDTYG
jgi:endonuclease/exonuclease/phosphatase family metal-dependent hydrolase